MKNHYSKITSLILLLSAAIGVLGVSAIVFWHLGTVSGTWRYKMTVIVETPEGLKLGSSVREVSATDIKFLRVFPGSGAQARLKGEAVVVDLGERGVLFALLKGFPDGHNYGTSVVYKAFPRNGGYLNEDGIRHYNELKTGRVVLPQKYYPLFVTFKNLEDPRTLTSVLEMTDTGRIPTEYMVDKNHFETLFGAGVKLKEVLIEMTDEEINWGIEEYLPWLPLRRSVKGSLASPVDDPTKDDTGLYLNGIEFSRGRFWT